METDFIFLVLPVNLNIAFYPITSGIVVAIIGVVALLLGSAMISASEVAFFSLNPSQKNYLKDKKTGRSRHVLNLLGNPERLLATILITNNFINISIVILSAFILSRVMDITEPRWLELLIQVVIVTFVLLLFGEIMPKLYASLTPVRFALLMAYPLIYCRKIFYPLASFLILSTFLVRKRLARKKHNISMEQLSDALDLASDDISDEKNILEGIVKFGNIEVTGIMKARTEMTAADIQTIFSELIRIIIDSGYSRIPVYSDSFDNIKGVLYIKDLLPHLSKPDSFKWQSLIRPPYFVPENKKIDDLLREFQTKKIHMAVVVDEYGGTSGIITLEDILEEIVGEISDEADEDDITYKQIDNNTFIFEGKISLNDFYKITDLPDNFFDPVRGDADTLAGLILEIKGEFPKAGDKIKYNNLHFFIESVDRRRIRQIKMEIQS